MWINNKHNNIKGLEDFYGIIFRIYFLEKKNDFSHIIEFFSNYYYL